MVERAAQSPVPGWGWEEEGALRTQAPRPGAQVRGPLARHRGWVWGKMLADWLPLYAPWW